MAQQSLRLEAIQKQHEELLNRSLDTNEGDISRIQEFLETLAQAGAYTEDPEERSLLRSLIRYWASFIDERTGKFPIVQLLPFNELYSSNKLIPISVTDGSSVNAESGVGGHLNTRIDHFANDTVVEPSKQASQSESESSSGTTAIIAKPWPHSTPPLPASSRVRQNSAWRMIKRLFEIDVYFLSAPKYRLFRFWGFVCIISASIALGIWQHSWWLGLGALVASLSVFLFFIVIISKALMMLLAILLAAYWGIVGWILGAVIQLTTQAGWFPPPNIVGILFFVISFLVHFRYVRNKDLL